MKAEKGWGSAQYRKEALNIKEENILCQGFIKENAEEPCNS